MIHHSSYGFITTAGGVHLRYGIFPGKKHRNAGCVILLSGRTEFMEKYSETIRDLQHRGYEVFTFDWRGQGLSTRPLQNRHKGFIDDYQEYIDDLDIFFKTVVKPRAAGPYILLAHSMGAHIALRYLHLHPTAVKKTILISPMFDINTAPFPRKVAKLLTRIMVNFPVRRSRHAYAFGQSDYHFDNHLFENNPLTSDPVRFMADKTEIEKNNHLALGGVTFGWLEATYDSIEKIHRPEFLHGITTPVLIVGAGADTVVCMKAQKHVCAHLPDCRMEIIPCARHELLMERNIFRNVFWDIFDSFTVT